VVLGAVVANCSEDRLLKTPLSNIRSRKRPACSEPRSSGERRVPAAFAGTARTVGAVAAITIASTKRPFSVRRMTAVLAHDPSTARPERPDARSRHSESLRSGCAKFGCGTGLCGACMVHVDGRRAFSCQTQVSEIASRSVTTIEGLSPDSSHPLQKAWLAEPIGPR
jgi:hypothetical protein